MVRRQLLRGFTLAAAVLCASGALVAAQTGTESLGQVRLPRAVMANSQQLAAGTYTLRLTSESVESVVGQTPSEHKWVEFVQGGQVKGKELAIVLSPDEVAQVAESSRPAPGRSRVEVLKSNDYVRVWLNRGGTNYLIYLAVTP